MSQDVFLISYFLCSEIGEFQKIVGGFIGMVDALAKEVEREKMKVKFFVLLRFAYIQAPSPW